MDYPYGGGSSLYDYEIVFIAELTAYIVIGGYNGKKRWLSNIAIFANSSWSDAGHLNSGRDVSQLLIFVFFMSHLREPVVARSFACKTEVVLQLILEI